MSMSVNDLKIAVLMGGIGSEREVSLLTGANIAAAVSKAGYCVVQSDITPDDMSILDDSTIDLFFLGLHGRFGEDGTLQKFLEERGLVFTGSGSKASAAAFDKHTSKTIWKQAGINVPKDIRIDGSARLESVAEELAKFGEKFVVKPITQGSSVGVEIITGPEAAAKAGFNCLSEYGDCMIEEFIPGREITVGILLEKTLPIIEVRSKAVFYDYNAKYLDDATEYLFGTIDDKELIDRINNIAYKCHSTLGCRHLSRVDMIITEDGTPYVLEINTLPGFTSHSLIPMAAKKAGIGADFLCDKIIRSALNKEKVTGM